ncbi:MAG: hypothetical protein H7839_06185 [Magnetococcus sp. YQC-5]
MLLAFSPASWADPPTLEEAISRYVVVPLEADTSALTQQEKKMLPLLTEAAQAMDDLFWQQTYGDPVALMTLPWTPTARQLLRIHFGPWDRLEGNRAMLPGIAPKPSGGRYYPSDLSKADLEAAAKEYPALKNPFTLVRRDQSKALIAVPYHQAFSRLLTLSADRLRQAATLAEDPGQARYLSLRAEALLTDQYQESDKAWMEMKNNHLDLIIGPIEAYDDTLLGLKTAYEALLLIKNRTWDQHLTRILQRLEYHQARLPTLPQYRTETPALESDLGVYDVLLMTGDAAATRPIAINLPNDEQVQLEKGSRRMQLRNAMQAKFNKILLPMATELLDPEQLSRVSFEALFVNTLFHEVAHGLGVKKCVNQTGTVNDALQENAWMMEEGKADALSLLIGDLDAELEQKSGHQVSVTEADRYITEFASLFRAIRFGPTSSHARANLIRFNYLLERQAFIRHKDGHYHVDIRRMKEALQELAGLILRLQGECDAEGVAAWEKQYGTPGPELTADLRRMEAKGIPADVVFHSIR